MNRQAGVRTPPRLWKPLVALIIALVAAELAIRALVRTDEDGNRFLLERRLRPYHTPARRVASSVELFETLDPFIQYDEELGWAPRPSSTSRNGLYHYDADGARVSEPSAAAPGTSDDDVAPDGGGESGIAIFGDSFAHGDDVPYSASLAAHLAHELAARGCPRSVLNLAVPGFGMDQAFLRYRKLRNDLGVDTIVFGFQAENILRNVNIVRPLLWLDTGLAFSKPRFVLSPDGARFVNQPPVSPAKLPDLLERFGSWEYASLEWFYDPDDYAKHWWQRSLLLSAAERAFRGPRNPRNAPENVFDPDVGPGALSLWIVTAFHDEVLADERRFIVVHLPKQQDLDAHPLQYQELLERIAAQFDFVDPRPAMQAYSKSANASSVFVGEASNGTVSRHYSSAGNAIVATVLAEELACDKEH